MNGAVDPEAVLATQAKDCGVVWPLPIELALPCAVAPPPATAGSASPTAAVVVKTAPSETGVADKPRPVLMALQVASFTPMNAKESIPLVVVSVPMPLM